MFGIMQDSEILSSAYSSGMAAGENDAEYIARYLENDDDINKFLGQLLTYLRNNFKWKSSRVGADRTRGCRLVISVSLSCTLRPVAGSIFPTERTSFSRPSRILLSFQGLFRIKKTKPNDGHFHRGPTQAGQGAVYWPRLCFAFIVYRFGRAKRGFQRRLKCGRNFYVYNFPS